MYISLMCNGCNRKFTGRCKSDCKHYPAPKDLYEPIKESKKYEQYDIDNLEKKVDKDTGINVNFLNKKDRCKLESHFNNNKKLHDELKNMGKIIRDSQNLCRTCEMTNTVECWNSNKEVCDGCTLLCSAYRQTK